MWGKSWFCFLEPLLLGYFRGWHFKGIASSLKSKFSKEYYVFKVVRCQALFLEDEFPSRLLCNSKKKLLDFFRAAGGSWTICWTRELSAISFCTLPFLNVNFKLQSPLKVNPRCSSQCPASNLRRFCSAVLSLTLCEAGQGSLAPHVQ